MHKNPLKQQQGNRINTLWQGTKGNQSLLVNDVKRYDMKYVISLSDCVSLHTHLCKHTNMHCKILDVASNCLSRAWPTTLVQWRKAHSLSVWLQWDNSLQFLVILNPKCWDTDIKKRKCAFFWVFLYCHSITMINVLYNDIFLHTAAVLFLWLMSL